MNIKKYTEKLKKYTEKDDGLTAVEASIIVPIVLMVIMVMLYLGLILYQQTSLQAIVNETASSVGQIYSTKTKDPFIGFTKPSTLSETEYYRSFINLVGNVSGAHNTLDSEVERKAIWYAKHRLSSTRIYKESAGLEIFVDFERVPGSIMQRAVVVKGVVNYDLPFVKFFGIMDSTVRVTAVGRAQCFDILETGSTVSVITSFMEQSLDVMAPAFADVVQAIKDFVFKFVTGVVT